MFNAAVDGRPNLNVSCADGSLVAWKVMVTDSALKVKAAGGQTLINLASNLNWRKNNVIKFYLYQPMQQYIE